MADIQSQKLIFTILLNFTDFSLKSLEVEFLIYTEFI